MNNETDGPWVRVLDASTSRDELEAIIREHTQFVLDDLFEQINAMRATTAEKAAAWRLAAPLAEAKTRAGLLSAWAELRSLAAPFNSSIH